MSPPYVKVLWIDIGCKHDVFMCYKGIVKSFEILEYVKPFNEGIASVCFRELEVFG